MRKYFKNKGFLYLTLFSLLFVTACEKFLDPKQELYITESELYDDIYEYRSIEMGMYGLQQDLVEQLVVLGELRADLLTVTKNADADLVEINNFNISKANKYASPVKFFKLINATNNFIRVLERDQPDVMDPEAPISNYDRMYGEALCMRAWAYFNAVRIYGKVPLIPESLVTMEEIMDYVNTPGTYIDSVYIEYGLDGYENDTTFNKPIELERQLFDTKMIIDYFTNQLENDLKAVGVNHAIDINDDTWEVTIWNTYAMHALLGQMYLTDGDYANARAHFNEIVKKRANDVRYILRWNEFGFSRWRNIFYNVDINEHIYTLQFSKTNYQRNDFQNLFEVQRPYAHMLQPTRIATDKWETVYYGQSVNRSLANPEDHRMADRGTPGDSIRGQGVSYTYYKNGEPLDYDEYRTMLNKRYYGDGVSSKLIMENVDTIVSKYSLGKSLFSEDANFIIYRAGGIHLYMAELYTYWKFIDNEGNAVTRPTIAQQILNDGSNYDARGDREEVGVRGRAGIGIELTNYNQLIINSDDQIIITDIIYEHDPYTNEITGVKRLRGSLLAKQLWFEEQVLEERARELAFEGERFYDLMRVALRRDKPEFLAKKVAAKFTGAKRDAIEAYLSDPNNWYIHWFDE